jgi:hypothetical protein
MSPDFNQALKKYAGEADVSTEFATAPAWKNMRGQTVSNHL